MRVRSVSVSDWDDLQRPHQFTGGLQRSRQVLPGNEDSHHSSFSHCAGARPASQPLQQ
ncbi:hypothetical protein L1080_024865 [Rhodococcus sp. MSC1_016]|uniref:hypothetical protein n=1 Tax=Rhodococcus sp. MSC1_016 TaxID=2909266 RepID=UPI00202FD825|nr:hypothetical protein [Rhodococcus sp. MSC1_016]